MTLPFRPLNDRVAVSPQIELSHVAAAAEAGYRTIVNNRPDGEAMDQPSSADVAEAAKAAGLAYVHLPFTGADASPDQVKALADILNDPAAGPVLAFCRSGTRSSVLYSAAAVSLGAPIGEVIADAAKGGYDLSPYAPIINGLAQAAK
ncbi:TIGR01244 family sulfur transferase [Chthonobacter rhizosphaerae]|uniref:TIGR01244 family sulfur transferase n=1 Tax=Chthonobacter rhizosphaerae TaxID=2735553 RepID=UPI0015EF6910|nr:TIGR01244 family sulfur transferase [Chthonobacter rhizosphaerae]